MFIRFIETICSVLYVQLSCFASDNSFDSVLLQHHHHYLNVLEGASRLKQCLRRIAGVRCEAFIPECQVEARTKCSNDCTEIRTEKRSLTILTGRSVIERNDDHAKSRR